MLRIIYEQCLVKMLSNFSSKQEPTKCLGEEVFKFLLFFVLLFISVLLFSSGLGRF